MEMWEPVCSQKLVLRAKTTWWVNKDTEKQEFQWGRRKIKSAQLEDEQEVFQGGILYSSRLAHSILDPCFLGKPIY